VFCPSIRIRVDSLSFHSNSTFTFPNLGEGRDGGHNSPLNTLSNPLTSLRTGTEIIPAEGGSNALLRKQQRAHPFL
jgi:hypothetical protein